MMGIKATAWLPPSAVSSDRLEPVINHLLAEWAEHWFTGTSATAIVAFGDDGPLGSSEGVFRSFLPVASIACTRNVKALIAGAMLGVNVAHTLLQSGDWEVVEHLAMSCIDDLLRRVARLAQDAGSDVELGDARAELCDCQWWDISLGPRRGALKLAISASASVAIVKRRLPAAAQPKLGKLREGLGGHTIDLAADLGRCAVSLAELQDLNVGDTLVLDRSASEPVDLTVNGARSPLSASLETDEDQAILILAASRKKHNG